MTQTGPFRLPRGGRLIDRRKKREMGAGWYRLRAAVKAAPRLPPCAPAGLALRLAAGLTVYALLIWMHPFLFGVSPLP